ncbi:MAG: DUF1080 domain-containing protein [Verrucomicrobia bacterium]|nr:DUF1080 domain-containing protein [Verrucomicrobiota bacterium]
MRLQALVLLLTAAAGYLLAHAAPADSPKPNLVIILSDDYGYGSAGCYGADPKLIRTPNLDRLAREGRRFTQAYTPSSVCTPTRYAILTGRYCWRTPLNHGGVANTMDPLLIETNRPTLASLLKQHGYATAMIGKWHLGYGTAKRVDYTKELKPGPLELGFDYQFAVPQNHNDITRVFVENHQVFGLRSDKLSPAPSKLGLDAPERDDPKTMEQLTDRAVAWLEQQRGRPAPFFLYFAPVAVHELVTPSAQARGTGAAGPYGDFIHDLDRSVGRILTALEAIDAVERTLVVFTSDNGGVVARTSKSNTQARAMDAGLKINGALRGGKHDVWEGGFRVPFIARWPGRIPPGSVSDQMIGLVDLYATVAAVVGEPARDPGAVGPDSVNLWPAFTGTPEQSLRQDLILQSANGVYAIRSGPWKWIEGVPLAPPGRTPPGRQGPRADQFRPQLLNLEADPGEITDVSARYPEVVERLSARLQQHQAQGWADLWNGRDFTAWRFHLGKEGAGNQGTFTVQDGILHCSGRPAGYMFTQRSYRRYTLQLEYAFERPADLTNDAEFRGNSGCLIHVAEPNALGLWPRSVEVQGMHRDAGLILPIPRTLKCELTFDRSALERVRKPVGEWNLVEIEVNCGDMVIALNGTVISTVSGCELTEGPIGLQSENAATRWRSIRIREWPLPLALDPE